MDFQQISATSTATANQHVIPSNRFGEHQNLSSKVNLDGSSTGASKRRFILDIVLSTCQETTTHGIIPIINRDHIVIRLLWVVCLVASSVMCALVISISITSYFDYETVTKTEKVNLISTDFPAVTICNVSPFTTNVSAEFVQELLVKSFLINSSYTTQQTFSRMTADNLLVFRYFVNTNALDSNRSDQFRQSLGHNMSQLVFSCSYNFQKCTTDNWVWFYDVVYGNCYTFNSGKYQNKTSRPIEKSNKVGSENGLNMELFVYEPTDIRTLAISSGIRVMIHNQSQSPVYSDGMLIPVGAETHVRINRLFSSRLEQPYSECNSHIDEHHPSELVRLILSSGYSYTQRDCFLACYQYYLVDKCHCFDYSSLLPTSTFTNKSIQSCANLTQILCNSNKFIHLKRYIEFFSNEMSPFCRESCPLECESVNYNLFASSADYPSLVYAQVLVDNPVIQARYDDLLQLTYDSLKRTIMRVSIFYDDLGFVQYEETAKTDVVELVSNIGGTLGLFLGMSFLSFVEVFDILLQICFKKRKESNSKTIKVSPSNF